MQKATVRLQDGSLDDSNCIRFILVAPLSKIEILYKKIIEYIQKEGVNEEVKQNLIQKLF